MIYHFYIFDRKGKLLFLKEWSEIPFSSKESKKQNFPLQPVASNEKSVNVPQSDTKSLIVSSEFKNISPQSPDLSKTFEDLKLKSSLKTDETQLNESLTQGYGVDYNSPSQYIPEPSISIQSTHGFTKAVEEKSKLVYGVIYTLKNMALRLNRINHPEYEF